MSNWLKHIKNNLLIKVSQDEEEMFGEFYSQEHVDNMGDGLSDDIPEEIQFLVRQYLSLHSSSKSDEADITYSQIREKARELGVLWGAVEEYISDLWSEEGSFNALGDSPSEEVIQTESDIDMQREEIAPSFSRQLFIINSYIKTNLREDIVKYIENDRSDVLLGLASRGKKDSDLMFDFSQWVENSIFGISEKYILTSSGIGAKGKRDDIARFFSVFPQHLPSEYISSRWKAESATRLRSIYTVPIKSEGKAYPLFYLLFKKLIDLVDSRSVDLIRVCVDSIITSYNRWSASVYEERGESSMSTSSLGDKNFSPITTTPARVLSGEDRDDILDWKEKNKNRAGVSDLLDEEILERIRKEGVEKYIDDDVEKEDPVEEKIRQRALRDVRTQKIVNNLPNFYNSLLLAVSKIDDIRDRIKDGIKDLAKTKMNKTVHVTIMESMLDRYSDSLDEIAQRVKRSVDEGASPMDVGLQIDMLNDNLVSFSYSRLHDSGRDEVSLDPLNENGSFDFKSDIPFYEALDRFGSSPVLKNKELLIDAESGGRRAVNKFVGLIVNDRAFAKDFVTSIGKVDDAEPRQAEPGILRGVAQDLYDLEIALRMTFYNYKVGDDGNRIPIAKTIGGSKPRYSMEIVRDKSHFENTKDERKAILNQYLLSKDGEGIKNISVLQRAIPVAILGARRKIQGNKTNLKKKTLKLLLPTIEDMSDHFRNDSLSKSILASIITSLRVDVVMCDLLGMVGKKALKKGVVPRSVIHTYDDLINNADDNSKRLIELYVDLFNLRRDGTVDINELKIHCLRSRYSGLSPELRFALVSDAISNNTIDDALREDQRVGRARAERLISHTIDRTSFSIEDRYTYKVSSVKRRLSLLKNMS